MKSGQHPIVEFMGPKPRPSREQRAPPDTAAASSAGGAGVGRVVASVGMTDAWFDGMHVDGEQRDLLSWMVEGERSLPGDQHGSFLLGATLGGSFLLHPFLGERPGVRRGDLETLADSGLLRRYVNSSGDPLYDITPQGRRYYAEMKRRDRAATAGIEQEIRSFLDADAFSRAFPDAYQRWREAEEALWGADDVGQMTRIGHTCREALQAFASALAERSRVRDVPSDPARTVDRIRAVLNTPALGDAHRAMLQALLAYWGTVSDLVQRQEHGAQKEGEALMWEDARRVVFQTAVVMFEIARAVA